MIVNSSASQIEDKAYAPLVMVKNGVVTHLFSDGLLKFGAVNKLQLPTARYDYVLKVYTFYQSTGGSFYSGGFTCYFINRMQTEFTMPNIASNSWLFLEAELITKEI